MKPIQDLKLNFRDAENFGQRENKTLFSKIFIRLPQLEKVIASNVYFLLGEKGTGKTAFATYLKNFPYTNSSQKVFYSEVKKISETDYPIFINLKKEKHLTLSDYPTIWKVMLYFLMSQKICKDEPGVLLSPFATKFKILKEAIAEYNNGDAFNPEIINAITFVEKSSDSAQLFLKHFKLGGEESEEHSFTESRFQNNLFYLQKKFENALGAIKLTRNHLLFIDGIDIKPDDISHEEYLECIKGLAKAVWDINSTFFSNIRDSKGRQRVILIMRPDIFATTRLTNLNSKLNDNSVIIDWRFNNSEKYRESEIFEMADKLLYAQQDTSSTFELGKTWDYYFPEKIFIKSRNYEHDSFIQLLRYSLFKPRDIIAMLQILQKNFINHKHRTNPVFSTHDLEFRGFKEACARYMWSEIKEYLKFYYSPKDESIFRSFFSFLQKFEFSYTEFCESYNMFLLDKKNIKLPLFFETADTFLQLLYDLNVICYLDSNQKHHYSYREKDYSDMQPTVQREKTYQLHPALSTRLYAI